MKWCVVVSLGIKVCVVWFCVVGWWLLDMLWVFMLVVCDLIVFYWLFGILCYFLGMFVWVLEIVCVVVLGGVVWCM